MGLEDKLENCEERHWGCLRTMYPSKLWHHFNTQNTYTHIYIYLHIDICIHISICIRDYTCTYVCIFTYGYIIWLYAYT